MNVFDIIAEERILAAIARGEFDNLPGAGKPLDLGDDLLVPEELRVAYRILKNAGCVPPEIEARKEIRRVEDLVGGMLDGEERRRALAKLQYLRLKLSMSRGGRGSLRIEAQYYVKVVEKLGGHH